MSEIKIPVRFQVSKRTREAYAAGYVKGLADRLRVAVADTSIAVFASRVADRFGPFAAGALPMILPELADDMARATVEPEPAPSSSPAPEPPPCGCGSINVEPAARLPADCWTCRDCGAVFRVRPAPSSSTAPSWPPATCACGGIFVRMKRGTGLWACNRCGVMPPPAPSSSPANPCPLCGAELVDRGPGGGFECPSCKTRSGRPRAWRNPSDNSGSRKGAARSTRSPGEAAIAATGGKLAPATAAQLEAFGAELAGGAIDAALAGVELRPASFGATRGFEVRAARAAELAPVIADAEARIATRARLAPGLRGLRAEIVAGRIARSRAASSAAGVRRWKGQDLAALDAPRLSESIMSEAAPELAELSDLARACDRACKVPAEIAGSHNDRPFRLGFRFGWNQGTRAGYLAAHSIIDRRERHAFRLGVRAGACARGAYRGPGKGGAR